MKRKQFTKLLTTEDLVDVRLFIQKGKIIQFAINYRAKINKKFKEIYRVDNYHGFLHEQRFWRTRKPIPIDEECLTNEQIVDKYFDFICLNYERFREYFIRSIEDDK